MTPPAAPLFLDCWSTESGGCELTWGLQAVDGGGYPIINTLLQYRAAEGDEWTPVPGPIEGNTRTFPGT